MSSGEHNSDHAQCLTKADLHNLEVAINDLNRRLFIGNGQEALTVQVSKNTEQLKGTRWWHRTLFMLMVPVVINTIYLVVKEFRG